MNYPPKPRTENVYVQDGKSIVAKVPHLNGDYLQASINTALDLLGGLDKSIQSGDRVMLKPNFNCAFRFPLSTDFGMLAAVIEVLQDIGAKVTVGEMCGVANWPTEKVIQGLGVLPFLKRYDVSFINFQFDEWIAVDIPGNYWITIHVPRSIYEAEKRVYLANMRCHSTSRFTASLKLSVGFLSPEDRENTLHVDRIFVGQKAAEINLAWQPNLVFVDGRRSTVAPSGRGDYVYPNVIMASGDMVAIDTEAVKILKTFPEKNEIGIPVEEQPHLTVAQAHGLGSMDYQLLVAEANVRTEQKERLTPEAYEIMQQL